MAESVAMRRHAPLQKTQLHTVINAYFFNNSHISVESKNTKISLFIYFLTLKYERNDDDCSAVTSWGFWSIRHDDVPSRLMLLFSNKKLRSLCLNKSKDSDIYHFLPSLPYGTCKSLAWRVSQPCMFLLQV